MLKNNFYSNESVGATRSSLDHTYFIKPVLFLFFTLFRCQFVLVSVLNRYDIGS